MTKDEHVCTDDTPSDVTITEADGFTKVTRTWYCSCGKPGSSGVIDTYMRGGE